MKKEINEYFSWLQMEKDLEDALRMLDEQNYGLLRNALDAIRVIARANKDATQKDKSPGDKPNPFSIH